MALTPAWVEREIKNRLQGANSPKNVTDFAIPCIARDHLREMQQLEPTKEGEKGYSGWALGRGQTAGS